MKAKGCVLTTQIVEACICFVTNYTEAAPKTFKKGNTSTAITYYEAMLCIHCAKYKMPSCKTLNQAQFSAYSVALVPVPGVLLVGRCYFHELSPSILTQRKKGQIQCAFMDTDTAKICRDLNPHIIQHIVKHQLASLRNPGLFRRKTHV